MPGPTRVCTLPFIPRYFLIKMNRVYFVFIGAVARKGDSGGGLMFRDPYNGRYYLRGIVSTADRDSALNIATFTDISKHLDWLYKVRIEVEKELIKNETTLNSKIDRVQG